MSSGSPNLGERQKRALRVSSSFILVQLKFLYDSELLKVAVEPSHGLQVQMDLKLVKAQVFYAREVYYLNLLNDED